ncbi:MerR family DNA-binding protein [Massilia sp. W12]|uniref:MerR family DNA-binding protein n=1 Tax=Massilia sp. W12 TaxID=3126507 RepID=UPI0030CEDE15
MEQGLLIGQLARASGVGVETIRYYQKRGLLPEGDEQQGAAFRRYPAALAGRIGFIRRAQGLGFTLEEISSLLRLHDGGERRAIHALAQEKLITIEQKINDLQQIAAALRPLLTACADLQHYPECPIIATLYTNPGEQQKMADGKDSAVNSTQCTSCA